MEWNVGKWGRARGPPANPVPLDKATVRRPNSAPGHAHLQSELGVKPCDPCSPLCPHLLLQATEGLRALSLQLVDALHESPNRGIFLRSGGHSWDMKPEP